MCEAVFKNIDDTLWKDAGCSSELDYIEQTSWILFLQYQDDYETEKETSAQLNGETYTQIIDGEFSRDWLCRSECYMRTLRFKRTKLSVGTLAYSTTDVV